MNNYEKESLGFHLDKAFAAVRAVLADELASRQIKLNHQQFSILQTIHRSPGLSQSALASSVGMDVAAVSRSTATLERRGLLVKRELNGCTNGLYLTEKSREMMPLLDGAIKATTRKCSEDLEPGELEATLASLRKIIARRAR